MKTLSRFKKSEYAKHSTILMTGTVVSMVLKALTTFWLAKYLGSALIGVYTLYCATYSILLVVATGRYELAIMLPKDDNDGFLLTMLSMGLSFAFSVIAMVSFVLYGWIFKINLDWILFLPLTLAILGVYYSANYWLNRKKCYIKLALNRIIQGVLFLAFSLMFYYIPSTRHFSLILGYIFSQGTVMIILIIYVVMDFKKYNFKVSFIRTKQLAKEYVNFPKLSVISGVVNNLSVKLPVFLLTFLVSDEIVGQYGMMESILAAPIAIISEAIRDVFRQKASRDYADDHECYYTYKTTFKMLALTAIIPFLLIMIGGKPIINTAYSSLKYDMAGNFIILMAPFYYIKFVVSPLTFMTYIASKQSFDLKWQFMLCISSAVAFFVGYLLTHNVYIMLLLYGIALAAMYMISFYYTRKLAKGEYI